MKRRRPQGNGAADAQHHFRKSDITIPSRESGWYERGIKESIYIRALSPSLNRNEGRHDLPLLRLFVADRPDQRETGANLIRFSDQPLSLSLSFDCVLNSNPIHDFPHPPSPSIVSLSASLFFLVFLCTPSLGICQSPDEVLLNNRRKFAFIFHPFSSNTLYDELRNSTCLIISLSPSGEFGKQKT